MNTREEDRTCFFSYHLLINFILLSKSFFIFGDRLAKSINPKNKNKIPGPMKKRSRMPKMIDNIAATIINNFR